MKDCLFCKIASGEIPSHKIYEDDQVLAFLDIHPASEGHTMVVPKKHQEFLWDLDDQTYSYLMSKAKKIALHLQKTLEPNRVGVIVDGSDVPHAHYHLIPLNKSLKSTHEDQDMSVDPDHQSLAELAKKLAIN